MRQYAVLFERRVQSSTRVRKAQVVTRQANPSGRSMIEMLGVLAIIGVLSVGGIAGYSKAMEKYKTNKIMQNYISLMFGLMPYVNKLPNSNQDGKGDIKDGVTELANSLNLIPSSWKIIDSKKISDEFGNQLHLFVRNKRLVADIYMLSNAQNNYKFCEDFTINVIQPLNSFLYYTRMFNGTEWYFGDKYCSNSRKCIKDMTLSVIDNYCRSCPQNKTCTLSIEFE